MGVSNLQNLSLEDVFVADQFLDPGMNLPLPMVSDLPSIHLDTTMVSHRLANSSTPNTPLYLSPSASGYHTSPTRPSQSPLTPINPLMTTTINSFSNTSTPVSPYTPSGALWNIPQIAEVSYTSRFTPMVSYSPLPRRTPPRLPRRRASMICHP